MLTLSYLTLLGLVSFTETLPRTAAPAPTTTTTASFLGVGDVTNLVRQEIVSVLKELKEAVTPPPPPPAKEKVVWDVLRSNKEDMRSILRELGFLGL